MTSLKYTIFTVTIFVSLTSFGLGGGGGGGVLGPMAMAVHDVNTLGVNGGGGGVRPEIVYKMGVQDGVVTFAYGQLVKNKWQIQKIEANEDTLNLDNAISNALIRSSVSGQWENLR